MRYIFTLLASLSLFATTQVAAQETVTNPLRYTASNKGKFYVYWGGNRGYFTNSDIHFRGEDYDFTIHDVKADDKPKGWHIDYINPSRMTIPQTNLRIGYFFHDKWNVSIGVDHMKYVMRQDQTVRISGDYYNKGTYGETIPGQPDHVKLTEDFLMFEHTDGLNYVNAEINRVEDVSSLFKIRNTDKFQVNVTGGAGLGLVIPRTNTTLLKKERYDKFHLSGYGASLKAGLNLTFFKHFFVQAELKGGYINMYDVRTTDSKKDKASHDFWFGQTIIVFGGIFKL